MAFRFRGETEIERRSEKEGRAEDLTRCLLLITHSLLLSTSGTFEFILFFCSVAMAILRFTYVLCFIFFLRAFRVR